MRRPVAVRVVGPLQWLVYPALVAAAVTIILALPVRLFGLGLPQPVLPLVLAFAWPLVRPSIIAPLILGMLGLALDVFWNTPLGLWATSVLAVYAAILAARNILLGQTTAVLFAWYAAGCGLAFAIAWCVMTATVGTPPSLIAALWQLLPTLLLFPIGNALIERFDDGDVRFR